MECEADEGFGSSESTEDMKELNFKEVINNLKCLNGQSAMKINGSSGTIEKMDTCGINESEVSSPAKETSVIKDEGTKKHPLLIGAKVRNSLKELVSRMQNSEKKPVSGDKGSNEDKIISSAVSKETSSVTHKRSIDSGNLFENFKINDIKIVAVQKEAIENKVAFTASEQIHEPMKPIVVEDFCEKTENGKEESVSMDVVEIDDMDQETASLNPDCDKNVQSNDNKDKVQNGHLEHLVTDINISKEMVKKEEEELDDSLLLDNDHNQPSPLGEEEDDALLLDTNDEKTKVLPVSTDTGKSEEIQFEDQRNGEQLNVMDRNGKQDVKDAKLEGVLQEESCASVQEDDLNEAQTATIDRKRPAEDNDSSAYASSNKRSRLDEMIGKLGNAIGISPEAVADKELYDEDEEDSIATTESAITKDEDTTTATEEEEEEMKVDEGDANRKKEKKYIRMTEKELEDLVWVKVAQYLKSQREGLFGMLQQRIKDLSTSNDRWKAEVKEMQIKINEVTVLQQKHEKRKAATAALRQITTRSVGIQVDETKVNKQTNASTGSPQTYVKQSKTPPRTVVVATTVNTTPIFTTPTGSNGTIRLPIPQSSLPPPIMPQVTQPVNMGQSPTSPIFQKMSPGTNNIPTTLAASAMFQRTTVRSLLDSTRQTPTVSTISPAGSNTPMTVIGLPQGGLFTQGTPGLIVVSTVAPPMNTASKSLLSKTTGAATSTATIITSTIPQLVQAPAVATVKVIDLTVDDDSASKQNKSAVTVQTNNQVRMSAPVTRPVVPTQQTIITQPHPQSPQGLILGPTLSTQIVRAPFTQPTTYQIVRSGNVLTVVSPASQNSPQAFRPAAPTVSSQPRPCQPNVPGTNVMSSVRQPCLPTVVPSQVSVPAVPTAIPVQVQAAKLSPMVTTYGISHPAPFPTVPTNQVQPGQKPLPPKPGLKISRVSQGIVLSWNMTISDTHAEIASYQLFAYQEGVAAPSSNLWKKVGEVKALPLPMACTLTQFQEGNKYHFAVRAVDVHNRVGHFSDPSSIHLLPMAAK